MWVSGSLLRFGAGRGLGEKAADLPCFLAGASDDSTTPPAMAMAVYQELHDAVSPHTADANLRRQWKDASLKICLWR